MQFQIVTTADAEIELRACGRHVSMVAKRLVRMPAWRDYCSFLKFQARNVFALLATMYIS